MEKMTALLEQISAGLAARAPRVDKADHLWDASVLVPLVDTKNGPAVLFEVRAEVLGWQPGDVCFPGGRYECGDDSFKQTAIRETCEELGLRQEQISICGQLDCLVTHMGPIVHPFVGKLSEWQDLDYNKDEVKELFTVPLRFLLENEPQIAHMHLGNLAGEDFPFELLPGQPHEWQKRKSYTVYIYRYEGHVIWGMTARILHGFLRRFGKELAANIL